jgi:hypothetical protein
MTNGRLIRLTVIACVFTLGTALSAMAQTHVVKLGTGQVAPGQATTVNLVLSSTADVAGMNFTVKLPNNNNLEFRKYDGNRVAELTSAMTAGGFTLDDHLVSNTEYRGLIYKPSGTQSTFPSGTDVVIAQIHLTAKAGAGVGANVAVTLDNGFTSDPTPVRLLALSDVTGNSIGLVDMGDAKGGQVPKQDGAVEIIQGAVFPPITVDFGPGQGNWTTLQVRPTFDNSDNPPIKVLHPGVGVGLKVLNASDTYGYYTSPASFIQTASPERAFSNVLMRANWTIASNTDNLGNAPIFFLQLNGSDFALAEVMVVQSSPTVSGGRISPGTAGKTYSQYFVPTESSQNTVGASGYIMTFALANNNPNYGGPVDSQAILKGVDIRGATLNTAGATPVAGFNYDFTASGTDTQGWASDVPANCYFIDLSNFPNTAQVSADNGLVMRSVNTDIAGGKYALAIWNAPTLPLAGSDSILYRLRMKIATLTPNPAQTPQFRVLVSSEDYQWIRIFEVNKKLPAPDADPSLAPTPEGKDYDLFFNYPAELNNVPVRISVYMVNIQTLDDPNGAFKIIGGQLHQMPLPTFN